MRIIPLTSLWKATVEPDQRQRNKRLQQLARQETRMARGGNAVRERSEADPRDIQEVEPRGCAIWRAVVEGSR